MVFEYAVDPTAINTWQEFRYVIDHCGADKGRVIADYPERWKREVFRACKKGCKDVELKRIEERLLAIDDILLKTDREYKNAWQWLDNAEEVNKTKPFRAVLSYHNPRKQITTLIVKELTAETPLWKTNRQTTVDRRGEKMAAVVRPLLQVSTEILFVDPHFDATEERFRNPLRCFVGEINHNQHSPIRIEYHLLASDKLSTDAFANGCNHLMPALLPANVSIKFIRWKDFEAWQDGVGGKRLHPRFVLTNKGGVLVEWGLDEGPEGDTVDMILLEKEPHALHWSKYQRATSPFEFVDEIVVVGTE